MNKTKKRIRESGESERVVRGNYRTVKIGALVWEKNKTKKKKMMEGRKGKEKTK